MAVQVSIIISFNVYKLTHYNTSATQKKHKHTCFIFVNWTDMQNKFGKGFPDKFLISLQCKLFLGLQEYE